ncbi:protein-tyrosine phosphatase family protein [Spiroplasma culicicola]|uniref:Tyrosine specific protein phosphatases domain-containing protein n=1 Tax=Spiroplasma culicicola AES-1 TaxID=1276246 RepID=W6A852_9MOLU|nr:dual specificity protein phosphatase family protein [Spiroplasma culicicola]AHI53318.1 hypothetical protein SCULI_v1c09780 [Spiroplasma culicicola AES-1]
MGVLSWITKRTKTEIINHLWLGDMHNLPENKDMIINCSIELAKKHFKPQKEKINKFNFYQDGITTYATLPDRPMYRHIDKEFISKILQLMKNSLDMGKKVYMHCIYGVNRSASHVFMYCVKNNLIKGNNYKESRQEFLKIYPDFTPIFGWKKLLKKDYPYNNLTPE